ncbi:hypothetical protein ACWOE1_07740 [Dolosigranulum pigrum]|nr:hypothetical protein [Dolosigranulum pigrum]
MGFFFKLSPVLLMIILIFNLIIEIFVTEQASYISKDQLVATVLCVLIILILGSIQSIAEISESSFISNMSSIEAVYLYSGLLFAGKIIHYVKQR